MGEGGLGQGGNSAVIRHYNERVILTALRRMGEASKADLARRVNLTQNAAGQIVKGLEQQRLICTAGKRTGLRGQPATLMSLDPDGAYAIGIEIGRLSSDSVLMDFSGRVLVARQSPASVAHAPGRAVRRDGGRGRPARGAAAGHPAAADRRGHRGAVQPRKLAQRAGHPGRHLRRLERLRPSRTAACRAGRSRVHRERRHGRRGGRAVQRPGPRAGRLRCLVRGRGAGRRAGAERRLSQRRHRQRRRRWA